MRILIADDDPSSRKLLEHSLIRLGHMVESVTDGPDAITALLQPDGPRLAIVDWEMPGADGLVVCRVVRQRTDPYVYIILLTARSRIEDVVAGLDSGADDFLSKPFDAGELHARIRAGERVLNLQAGLLQTREALRVQATSDDLTGLANRRVVHEQLDRELKRARHERKPVAVAMADIDYFKRVNDQYGHPAGDAVLRQVARCMKLEVRDYDCVGRQGGEEFMFVLPGCDGAAAALVMDRVRASVAISPVHWEGSIIPITISIGIASTMPEVLDAAALTQRADEALYRAKANGQNCIEIGLNRAPRGELTRAADIASLMPRSSDTIPRTQVLIATACD